MILLDKWVEILFSYDDEGKPEFRDILTRAIIDYIYLGKDSKFEDDFLNRLWFLMKPIAECQRKKTQRRLTSQRNGRKGGRPRKDDSKGIRNN